MSLLHVMYPGRQRKYKGKTLSKNQLSYVSSCSLIKQIQGFFLSSDTFKNRI